MVFGMVLWYLLSVCWLFLVLVILKFIFLRMWWVILWMIFELLMMRYCFIRCNFILSFCFLCFFYVVVIGLVNMELSNWFILRIIISWLFRWCILFVIFVYCWLRFDGFGFVELDGSVRILLIVLMIRL